jgi:predicted Fe-Mo cluster-binding NifX family protein
MEVVYDLDKRRAYQQQVEVTRQAQHAAKQAAEAAAAAHRRSDFSVLVAVATEGQGKVNQHFGHATEFQIYELSAGRASFVGHRRVDLYCQGGYGEDEQLPSIVSAINDCHAVLVSKIGACPRDELLAAGIEPVDATRTSSSKARPWPGLAITAPGAARCPPAPGARRRAHPPGRVHGLTSRARHRSCRSLTPPTEHPPNRSAPWP